MSELFSADLSDKIYNVIGYFQDHYGDLPGYGHSYLNHYRERLAAIEGMTKSERFRFLGLLAELLESIAEDSASGFRYLAIKSLAQEVRQAIPAMRQ